MTARLVVRPADLAGSVSPRDSSLPIPLSRAACYHNTPCRRPEPHGRLATNENRHSPARCPPAGHATAFRPLPRWPQANGKRSWRTIEEPAAAGAAGGADDALGFVSRDLRAQLVDALIRSWGGHDWSPPLVLGLWPSQVTPLAGSDRPLPEERRRWRAG